MDGRLVGHWTPTLTLWQVRPSMTHSVRPALEVASTPPSESSTSDDSVEVRVRPVVLPSSTAASAPLAPRPRNKRKAAEPRRVDAKRVNLQQQCWTKDDSGRHVVGAEDAASDGGSIFGGDSDSNPGPSTSSRPGSRHQPQHTQEDSAPDFSVPSRSSSSQKQKQRNYKNMTRERRIEANARERTRVHTISAAFDSLRRAVPAYSCNQKLSKLAILRIACNYILALASLNGGDYSQEQDGPSFQECVDLCTRTIQNEGRARRRKE